MNSLWITIKTWIKIIVFTLLAVLIALFVVNNWSARVDSNLWVFFKTYDRPRLLPVLLVTGVGSVIAWWVLRIVLKAVHQLSQAQDQSRYERLDREATDLRQSKPAPPSSTADEPLPLQPPPADDQSHP